MFEDVKQQMQEKPAQNAIEQMQPHLNALARFMSGVQAGQIQDDTFLSWEDFVKGVQFICEVHSFQITLADVSDGSFAVFQHPEVGIPF